MGARVVVSWGRSKAPAPMVLVFVVRHLWRIVSIFVGLARPVRLYLILGVVPQQAFTVLLKSRGWARNSL